MSIAVVIPTRDRGAAVTRPLDSIRAGSVLPDEIVVVDQSRGTETREALEGPLGLGVWYVRSERAGIASSLNEGLERTRSVLIAITGDDCEVPPDWIERIVAEFESHPHVGVLFGNILPGAEESEEGFTPSYLRRHRSIARRPREQHRVGGTSACMALRRAVWERVGGFDDMLGVGASFGAAEDADLAFRALEAGYGVMGAPSVRVVHHGLVPWERRTALIERNWYGTGAALAKPLKRGRFDTLVPLACLGLRWALGRSRIARGLGSGRHRKDAVTAFLRGFRAGLAQPLDPATGRFTVQAVPRAHSRAKAVRPSRKSRPTDAKR